MADSRARHRREPADDAALLHDHAAAGGGALRVHSDAAVHSRAERQPGGVDGGALRSGERYGQLEVFEFPQQTIVYGPRQIIARINQDQVISPQITLWNQQGSQVIQGTLLVIPVGEALLYVRPLYLRASGGRIPALNRVIVAYKDQIVMEPTLDGALARIFGGDGAAARRPSIASTSTSTPAVGPEAAGRQAVPAATPNRADAASIERALPALRSRDAGTARRQLGVVRRRNQAVGRDTSRDAEMTEPASPGAILWQNWERRTRIDQLPPDCRPADREAGYSAQKDIVRCSGQNVVGWKIAATSAAGQKHIGVDGPLAGPLLANRVLSDGADRAARWEHHDGRRGRVRV